MPATGRWRLNGRCGAPLRDVGNRRSAPIYHSKVDGRRYSCFSGLRDRNPDVLEITEPLRIIKS